MMDSFEVAGKILHLPAFIRADLLALDAAAGAGTFRHAQFVDWVVTGRFSKLARCAVPCVASRAEALPPDRCAVEDRPDSPACDPSPRRSQKHLRQIGGGLQAIGARPVVPLLVSLQLKLYAQKFNLKIVGAPALIFGKAARVYRRVASPRRALASGRAA